MTTRQLLLFPALLLAACGGSTLRLELNSDDRTSAQSVQALSPATADLGTILSIHVKVAEVWVHVDDKDAKDGVEVAEESKKWVQLDIPRPATDPSAPLDVDLMDLRDDITLPVGSFEVPEGRLTQVRLKLAASGDGSERRIEDAVVEWVSGPLENPVTRTCDLVVPASAAQPGIKIQGAFKSMPLESGATYRAVVNIKLSELSKEDAGECAYRLNPVLKVKEFERVADAAADDAN